MARMVQVEAKRWHGAGEGRTFGWQVISVEDALHLQEDRFRCPECFGKVRLHRASVDPEMEAHAEHFARNKGCSLGDCFDGTRRPHSKTIL